MSKYSKKDEKLVKELFDSLYSQHQKLRGDALSGGSFFTDFLHGFTIPFKQFGHLLSLIPEVGPILGSVVTPVAEAIDKAVPGHRYETIADAMSGKKIQGTGRGRGRPKKVKVVNIPVQVPVKRKAGRPRGSKNKSKA